MPRLTSFSDGPEDQNEIPGIEWRIVAKQNFILTKYYACKGDQVLQVGLITNNKYRSIRAKLSLTGPIRHEVNITLDGVRVTFDMVMKDIGVHTFEPKIGSVYKVGTRTVFEIDGKGKGIYRSAWKDADIAKNIVGFINIDCVDPANEEELVWLFGSIGRHGLDMFVPSVE